MMTAPAAIAAAPTFAVHGELSPRAIAALARNLIAHARRELDAERAVAAAGAGDQEQERSGDVRQQLQPGGPA